MYKYLFSVAAVIAVMSSAAQARPFDYTYRHSDVKQYGYFGDIHDRGVEGSNEYMENPFTDNTVNHDFDKSRIKRYETGHTLRRQTLSTAEYNSVSLDRQAEYMKKYPHTDVFVVGHTDIKGSHNYNDGLGMRRAKEVKKQLVDRGIDPNRIHAVSAGEREVAFSNHDENRRTHSVLQD